MTRKLKRELLAFVASKNFKKKTGNGSGNSILKYANVAWKGGPSINSNLTKITSENRYQIGQFLTDRTSNGTNLQPT